MNPSKVLTSKVVKFYGQNAIQSPVKKTVTDQASIAYGHGQLARMMGLSITDNPYPKEDPNVIWTDYDAWSFGYLSRGNY